MTVAGAAPEATQARSASRASSTAAPSLSRCASARRARARRRRRSRRGPRGARAGPSGRAAAAPRRAGRAPRRRRRARRAARRRRARAAGRPRRRPRRSCRRRGRAASARRLPASSAAARRAARTPPAPASRRARIGVLVDDAERVRRAGRGERVSGRPRARRRSASGSPVARRDVLQLRARERPPAAAKQAYGRPAMWALRGPVSAIRAALQQRHAAAGGADDPAVDRADARRPAHHAQRAQHRPAALDDRDVRARAAALDDDRVARGRAGGAPRRRRPPGRADRERGTAAERVDAHRAAVAAQDEQRHVEARPPSSARSTTAAVRSTTGRMLALTAALTVRISRP